MAGGLLTQSLSEKEDRTVDQKRIIGEIVQFVRDYAERVPIVTKWKKPLVGFASADDPLFPKLKEVVRPSHALPRELLPAAQTVVAFFIPFENALQKENDQAGFYPARSWAVAYVETNRLISELDEHLKNLLEAEGFRTVFTPPTHHDDPAVLMSDWSHRHIAFIAGLGRFGLNRWLITEKGCCGRFGSLVTEAAFSPTPRPDQEFCLRFGGTECSACVEHCIYGALFIDRFDRHACNQHLLKNEGYFSDLDTSDVCGKCGCGLPCSTRNPMAKRSRT